MSWVDKNSKQRLNIPCPKFLRPEVFKTSEFSGFGNICINFAEFELLQDLKLFEHHVNTQNVLDVREFQISIFGMITLYRKSSLIDINQSHNQPLRV